MNSIKDNAEKLKASVLRFKRAAYNLIHKFKSAKRVLIIAEDKEGRIAVKIKGIDTISELQDLVISGMAEKGSLADAILLASCIKGDNDLFNKHIFLDSPEYPKNQII